MNAIKKKLKIRIKLIIDYLFHFIKHIYLLFLIKIHPQVQQVCLPRESSSCTHPGTSLSQGSTLSQPPPSYDTYPRDPHVSASLDTEYCEADKEILREQGSYA